MFVFAPKKHHPASVFTLNSFRISPRSPNLKLEVEWQSCMTPAICRFLNDALNGARTYQVVLRQF